MYSLDCSLKRIAFVVTEASAFPEEQQSSPIDTALDAVGSKVYEVFKTFCDSDVRLGFFLTEALQRHVRIASSYIGSMDSSRYRLIHFCSQESHVET